MTQLQIIQLDGQPIAVAVGAREAIISESVAPRDRPTVERMCVYALEIAAGSRLGPYRDGDATRHARLRWRRQS